MMINNLSDKHRSILFYVIIAVLILVGIYVVSLSRNSLKENRYIGKSPEFQDRITVLGSGKVTVSPDVANISVGIITESKTVSAATEENTSKMNKIIKAIKDDFDVDSDDIKTSNYRINPRYTYKENSGREITGYEVTQSLSIKVRDFDKIGNIISKAGDLGSNSISGPNFVIDDPEDFKAEAREQAIEQAKKKAKVLSSQVGIKLGDIVNFSENYGGYPVDNYARSNLSLDAGFGGAEMKSEPQIEAGTQEVNVSVSITYEIR
jgi:uncharacterized protein YggE